MSSPREGKPYPKDVTADVILASVNDPVKIISNAAATDNVISPSFVPTVLEHIKKLEQTDKAGLAKSRWQNADEKKPSPWQEVLTWSKLFAEQTQMVDKNKRDTNHQKKFIMISDKLISALNELEKVKISPEDKNGENAIKSLVCLFQGLYQRAVKKDQDFFSTKMMFSATKQTRTQALEKIHEVVVNLAKKFSGSSFYTEFDQANESLKDDIAVINGKYKVVDQDVQKVKASYNITEEDVRALEKEAKPLEPAAAMSTTASLASRFNNNVVRASVVDESIQANNRMFDNLVRIKTQIKTQDIPELQFNETLAKEMKLSPDEIEQWSKNWERILDVQDRRFFDETNPIWGSLMESTISVFKYGIDFFQTCLGKLKNLEDETANVNNLLKPKIDHAIAHVQKNIIIFTDIKPEIAKLADKLSQYILKKEDAKEENLERRKIAEGIYEVLNPERNSFVSPEHLLNRLEQKLNSARDSLTKLKSVGWSSDGALTGIIKDATNQIENFRKKYNLEREVISEYKHSAPNQGAQSAQVEEERTQTLRHR